MILFGPIPSRRLGRSLGINNIPPKHCSYSCVYCQIGRTNAMGKTRSSFYDPEQILNETTLKIEELKKSNERVDYLSFVPDGEPTIYQTKTQLHECNRYGYGLVNFGGAEGDRTLDLYNAIVALSQTELQPH